MTAPSAIRSRAFARRAERGHHGADRGKHGERRAERQAHPRDRYLEEDGVHARSFCR